jgi:peptidoglycan/LPS O-acetylase OafA/YrhL
MWTIAYEFRCYLMIAILGLAGLLGTRLRFLLLALVAACYFVATTGVLETTRSVSGALFGSPSVSLSLFAIFGTGAVYYLFREQIPLTLLGALVSAVALTAAMFSPVWAGVAYGVLGGYLIFWFAFKIRVLFLSKFDNNIDISYGLYLYAFPIQNIFIYCNRAVDPWILTAITLVLASLAAYASWIFIEKPSLDALRKPSVAAGQPGRAIFSQE